MNDLKFETEKEKQEYIGEIFTLLNPLREKMDLLEEARANGENVESILKKVENFSTLVYVINNLYQNVRDKYREENTMLIYGQERVFLDRLHETANHMDQAGEYVYNGGLYDIQPWDFQQGEALKREFMNNLRKVDLSQQPAQSFNKQPKVKKIV